MVAFQMEVACRNNDLEKENSSSDIENISKASDHHGILCNNQNEQVDKKHKTGFVIDDQLKELLLLQLDLIEHQQSKITQKDKQIISLQGEKDQVSFIAYFKKLYI